MSNYIVKGRAASFSSEKQPDIFNGTVTFHSTIGCTLRLLRVVEVQQGHFI